MTLYEQDGFEKNMYGGEEDLQGKVWKWAQRIMVFHYRKNLGSFVYYGLWERRVRMAISPFEEGYGIAKVYGF